MSSCFSPRARFVEVTCEGDLTERPREIEVGEAGEGGVREQGDIILNDLTAQLDLFVDFYCSWLGLFSWRLSRSMLC